jgi:serine/threonine protein phosphatase PrpC
MTRRDDHSGCTGVTALVTATHVILANCGDSRACLLGTTALGGTGHLVTQRTKDHKPSDPAEAARIEAAVIGRVNGDLAVSRALGDFGFKTHPTLPPEKQMVRGWRWVGGGGRGVVPVAPQMTVALRPAVRRCRASRTSRWSPACRARRM